VETSTSIAVVTWPAANVVVVPPQDWLWSPAAVKKTAQLPAVFVT
jgi:hypothetical protein